MTSENSDIELNPAIVSRPTYRQNLPAIAPSLLKLCDVLIITNVGFLVYFLYVNPHNFNIDARYISAIALAAIVYMTLFESRAAIERRSALRSERWRICNTSIGRALWALLFTACLLLLLGFGLKVTAQYSRIWAGVWLFSTGICLIACRFFAEPWLVRLARNGVFARRTVIYGDDENSRALASHLERTKNFGVAVLGFIDDQKVPQKERRSNLNQSNKLLGDVSTLLHMIQSNDVDQVIVPFSGTVDENSREFISKLALTPVRVLLAPPMPDPMIFNRRVELIADVPMLELFNRPISGWSFVQKELEDRILACILLIFLAPLMALIAIGIKCDSPGPIFFRQVRYGYNKQKIMIWKFRTMYTHMVDTEGHIQTMRNDPRVTRFGRFLRRSSLDEIPQLLNVLDGTMSLVGPRPHALGTRVAGKSFEEVIEHYIARHKVKPGITGWAQINGYRGETDTLDKAKKRIEYDLYYIDNWSLWFDFYILLRTILVLFWDDAAY